MLYIFHVDTGSMMTFEMNLALESVAHLKEVIERACRIPPQKQVLLVSGGLSLEPAARVCSYAAGTDTNPIFLFSKCSIESVSPPSPSIDYGSDLNLKAQVEDSLNMPASYNTVVVRAQLAQQFCELAKDQTRICERLVHDQHLQQQGWAAVVANLEDSVSVFRNQGEMFEQSYQQHLESRAQYVNLLENFNDVLSTLAKIPVLPELLATTGDNMQVVESKSKGGNITEALPDAENSSSSMSTAATSDENEPMAVSKKSDSSSGEDWQKQQGAKTVTLLQWISTKDNQSTLEMMVEQCGRGLEQLDERVLEALRAEVQSALEAATKADMKEIKGLEERLFGLEQLMFESKRIVQEQSDLATGFQQNQVRANTLGDASILPDLCASHVRQLHVMSQNHTRLREIRKRCSRAKEELSVNLYHRLRWIMYVENRMCEIASKLMIYHENLKRLRRHLEVVRQIQIAPQMYVCAVGEVVRRRTFSQAFLSWAGKLSSELQTIHAEELARRRDFLSKFEGHFLNTLFPGMEDCPPPFATQAPAPFDVMLPKLSKDDVARLKTDVPNLMMSFTMPDLDHLADLFTYSLHKHHRPSANDTTEEKLVNAVNTACLQSCDEKQTDIPGQEVKATLKSKSTSDSPSSLPLKYDRDFESETDTDEFEKVGQSPVEIDRTSASEATSEENLGSAQLPVEQTKARLSSVEKIAFAATGKLREELGLIRRQVAVERDDFIKLLDTFRVAWEQFLTAGNAAQCATDTLDLRVELEKERIASNAKDEIIRTLTQSVEDQVEKVEASLRQRLKVEEEQRAQSEHLQRYLEETQSVDTSSSDRQRCAELERRMAELKISIAHYEELESRLDIISRAAEAEQTRALEKQKASLEALYQQRMKLLQEEAEAEKKRCIKEVSDQLSREHQSQLEGLRSRFRLMAYTSNERTLSESSIDKTEACRISKVDFDMETLEKEKEAAIQAAVKETEKRLQAEWEEKLKQELQTMQLQMEAEKQVWFNGAMRRVAGDNERQMSNLNRKLLAVRARETALEEECEKLKQTICRLTGNAGSSAGNSECNEALWQLQELVKKLESELAKTQHSGLGAPAAMGESVSSRDVATSPEPLSLKKNLTCSANSLLQQGRITILSCAPGDAVLVVWNDTYQNYVILQESSSLFFVHSDCLESLGLSLQADSGKRKIYSIAEVCEKEYCHAKKSENRFHVPKGTKFYRVKVRPLQEDFSVLKSSFRPKSQQIQHHHEDNMQEKDISITNESEPTSQPCEASGPPSGSSAGSLPDFAVTDASQ